MNSNDNITVEITLHGLDWLALRKLALTLEALATKISDEDARQMRQQTAALRRLLWDIDIEHQKRMAAAIEHSTRGRT